MALRLWWGGVLVVVGMLVSESAFAAQVAYSFEQLLGILKPGDIVIVSDETGTEVFGRVVDLTADRLGIGTGTRESDDVTAFVADADTVFTIGQVSRIRRADFAGTAGKHIFERPTRTFGETSQVLKPGERVTVTATDGTKTTGTIAEIGAARISVRGNSVRTFAEAEIAAVSSVRTFTETDVAAIERWTRDSVWEGVAVGGGLGAPGGVLWVGRLYVPNASDGFAPIMMLSIGAGAGIGALVDLAHGGGRAPLYVRPATVSRVAAVTPIVGPKRLGLAYGIQW